MQSARRPCASVRHSILRRDRREARSAWIDAEPAPAAHALRGATQPDGSILYNTTPTKNTRSSRRGRPPRCVRSWTRRPTSVASIDADGGKPLVFSSSMAIVRAASTSARKSAGKPA